MKLFPLGVYAFAQSSISEWYLHWALFLVALSPEIPQVEGERAGKVSWLRIDLRFALKSPTGSSAVATAASMLPPPFMPPLEV